MDHDGARRLMAEAMEGRLGTEQERELALHLVGCEDCKLVYEGLQHANPALSAIQLGEPSTEAVDAAVRRATTVLRGEADPGPMGLSDDAPGLPDDLDTNTVRIDSGAPSLPDIHLPPPVTAAPGAPAIPPTGPMTPPEAHVRAIEAEPQPEVPEEPEVPPVEPPPSDLDPGGEVDAEPLLPPELGPELGTELDPPPQHITEETVIERGPSEIDSLLEADRRRFEPLPYPEQFGGPASDDIDDDRMGAGPWLVAIAVTIALAVLAGVLITRGQGLFGGGGDLPSADEVRTRVTRAFGDMKSLKTSFDIQRLSLYRTGRGEGSLTYTFATGRWSGSIDYDRAEGHKQDFVLQVRDDEISRADVVQTADETRSLIGAGDAANLVVENDPPLGPPDGALRPSMGLLEDALGVPADLIAAAENLEVLRITERDGRELFEVRLDVEANDLTRADRIEAALDGTSFMPVIVKRSISRENARVLGPSEALSDENLDTAFGSNERITTELVELSNLQYDEIVLPGDLTLEAPDGVEPQTRDSGFERITRAELGPRLDFDPLLPRSIPGEYEEQLYAIDTNEKRKWGPGNTLPGPESVFHAQYFDGSTTIVVTQRRQASRFELDGSPLQRAGLPITVGTVEFGGQTFSYGSSPEVVPHAYGFIGNVFVMASGYAPKEDLAAMLASLQPTKVDAEAPLVSASPSASGSPSATGSAPPAVSPAPTASAAPAATG